MNRRKRSLLIALSLLILVPTGGLSWSLLRERTAENERRFYNFLARHPVLATGVEAVFDVVGRDEEFWQGWALAQLELLSERNRELLDAKGCVILDIPTPAAAASKLTP